MSITVLTGEKEKISKWLEEFAESSSAGTVLAVSPADVSSKYVGATAKAIQKIFNEARDKDEKIAIVLRDAGDYLAWDEEKSVMHSMAAEEMYNIVISEAAKSCHGDAAAIDLVVENDGGALQKIDSFSRNLKVLDL